MAPLRESQPTMKRMCCSTDHCAEVLRLRSPRVNSGASPYRVSLAQEINRIVNRTQKVLDDTNIKLAYVATDGLGI